MVGLDCETLNYGTQRLPNHLAFVDGNKRAALLAALVFLEINGWALAIGDTQATLQAIRMMEGVASGDFSEQLLTEWMEQRCWRIELRKF